MNTYQDLYLYKLLQPAEETYYDFKEMLDGSSDEIIIYDTLRTRCEILNDKDQIVLKLLIKHFCCTEKIKYKQGLIEVLAPFLHLQSKGMPLTVTYTCFQIFMARCLPNMFEEASRTLSGLFKILRLLITYFQPELSEFFVNIHITPEYFATSWLLTAFSLQINDIELVYRLWEQLIQSSNLYFLCFLCLGLLEVHKPIILAHDSTEVLVYLSSIQITSSEEVENIVIKAKFFENHLSESIKFWLKAFNVFELKDINEKLNALDDFWILKTLAVEYYKYLYPEHLPSHEISGKMLILVDCRLEADQNNGHLANSALFPIESLAEKNRVNDFIDSFMSIKGICQFIIMAEDEITENSVESLLVQEFLLKSFSFVTIAKGGFTECHKFAEQHQIKLKTHHSTRCKPCLMSKKKPRKLSDYLWPSKSNHPRRSSDDHPIEDYFLYYLSWT